MLHAQLVQPAVTHVCTQVPGAGKGNTFPFPATSACVQTWVTAGWTNAQCESAFIACDTLQVLIFTGGRGVLFYDSKTWL